MPFDLESYRKKLSQQYGVDVAPDEAAQDAFSKTRTKKPGEDFESWTQRMGVAEPVRQAKIQRDRERNTEEMGSWQRGLRRGLEQTEGLAWGAAGLIGDAIGWEGLQEKGFEGYKRSMEDAQRYESTTSFQDLTKDFSFSSLGDWIAGTSGELFPTMAAGLLSGGAGAVAGTAARTGAKKLGKEFIEQGLDRAVQKQVAKGLVKEGGEEAAKKLAMRGLGGQAGVVGGMGALEGGGMYGEAAEELGLEQADPYKAGLLGLAAGTVELAGGNIRILKKILGTKADDAINDIVKKARKPNTRPEAMNKLSGLLREAKKQAPAEFSQEATQEIMAIANMNWQDPEAREVLTSENAWQLVEAGMAGGLMGLMGAPAARTAGYVRGEQDAADPKAARTQLEQKIKNQEAALAKGGDSVAPGLKKRLEENRAQLIELDQAIAEGDKATQEAEAKKEAKRAAKKDKKAAKKKGATPSVQEQESTAAVTSESIDTQQEIVDDTREKILAMAGANLNAGPLRKRLEKEKEELERLKEEHRTHTGVEPKPSKRGQDEADTKAMEQLRKIDNALDSGADLSQFSEKFEKELGDEGEGTHENIRSYLQGHKKILEERLSEQGKKKYEQQKFQTQAQTPKQTSWEDVFEDSDIDFTGIEYDDMGFAAEEEVGQQEQTEQQLGQQEQTEQKTEQKTEQQQEQPGQQAKEESRDEIDERLDYLSQELKDPNTPDAEIDDIINEINVLSSRKRKRRRGQQQGQQESDLGTEFTREEDQTPPPTIAKKEGQPRKEKQPQEQKKEQPQEKVEDQEMTPDLIREDVQTGPAQEVVTPTTPEGAAEFEPVSQFDQSFQESAERSPRTGPTPQETVTPSTPEGAAEFEPVSQFDQAATQAVEESPVGKQPVDDLETMSDADLRGMAQEMGIPKTFTRKTAAPSKGEKSGNELVDELHKKLQEAGEPRAKRDLQGYTKKQLQLMAKDYGVSTEHASEISEESWSPSRQELLTEIRKQRKPKAEKGKETTSEAVAEDKESSRLGLLSEAERRQWDPRIREGDPGPGRMKYTKQEKEQYKVGEYIGEEVTAAEDELHDKYETVDEDGNASLDMAGLYSEVKKAMQDVENAEKIKGLEGKELRAALKELGFADTDLEETPKGLRSGKQKITDAVSRINNKAGQALRRWEAAYKLLNQYDPRAAQLGSRFPLPTNKELRQERLKERESRFNDPTTKEMNSERDERDPKRRNSIPASLYNFFNKHGYNFAVDANGNPVVVRTENTPRKQGEDQFYANVDKLYEQGYIDGSTSGFIIGLPFRVPYKKTAKERLRSKEIKGKFDRVPEFYFVPQKTRDVLARAVDKFWGKGEYQEEGKQRRKFERARERNLYTPVEDRNVLMFAEGEKQGLERIDVEEISPDVAQQVADEYAQYEEKLQRYEENTRAKVEQDLGEIFSLFDFPPGADHKTRIEITREAERKLFERDTFRKATRLLGEIFRELGIHNKLDLEAKEVRGNRLDPGDIVRKDGKPYIVEQRSGNKSGWVLQEMGNPDKKGTVKNEDKIYRLPPIDDYFKKALRGRLKRETGKREEDTYGEALFQRRMRSKVKGLHTAIRKEGKKPPPMAKILTDPNTGERRLRVLYDPQSVHFREYEINEERQVDQKKLAALSQQLKDNVGKTRREMESEQNKRFGQVDAAIRTVLGEDVSISKRGLIKALNDSRWNLRGLIKNLITEYGVDENAVVSRLHNAGFKNLQELRKTARDASISAFATEEGSQFAVDRADLHRGDSKGEGSYDDTEFYEFREDDGVNTYLSDFSEEGESLKEKEIKEAEDKEASAGHPYKSKEEYQNEDGTWNKEKIAEFQNEVVKRERDKKIHPSKATPGDKISIEEVEASTTLADSKGFWDKKRAEAKKKGKGLSDYQSVSVTDLNASNAFVDVLMELEEAKKKGEIDEYDIYVTTSSEQPRIWAKKYQRDPKTGKPMKGKDEKPERQFSYYPTKVWDGRSEGIMAEGVVEMEDETSDKVLTRSDVENFRKQGLVRQEKPSQHKTRASEVLIDIGDGDTAWYGIIEDKSSPGLGLDPTKEEIRHDDAIAQAKQADYGIRMRLTRTEWNAARTEADLPQVSEADSAEANRLIDKINKKMKHGLAGRIRIVESFNDLPKSVQEQAIGANLHRVVKAARSEDGIYIIRSRHATTADVVKSFIHERAGHIGLKKALIDKDVSYDAYLDSIYKKFKGEAEGIRTRRGLPDSLIGRRDAAEEVIAEKLANVEIDKDGKIKSKELGMMFDRVVAFVQRALRKIGLVDHVHFTRAEIKSLAAHAYKGLDIKYAAGFGRTFNDLVRPGGLGSLDTFKNYEARATDKLVVNIQDRFRALEQLQRTMEQEGVKITDELDVYGHTGQYESRQRKQLDKFEAEHFEPLLKEMRKAGVTHTQLDQYMENNAVPEGVDAKTMAGLHDRIMAIEKKSKDLLRDYDLRGPRKELEFEIESHGKTIDAVSRVQGIIMHGEKNSVKKAFMKLISQRPSDMFEIHRVEADENGIPNIAQEEWDKYVNVLSGNKRYLIDIKNEYLKKSIENMDPQQANRLVKFIGRRNRNLASLMIKYNPQFWPTNFLRDAATGLIHLKIGGEAIGGEALASKVGKNIFSAMKGMNRSMKGLDTDWQNMVDRFQEAGGQAGYSMLAEVKQLENHAEALQRVFERHTERKTSALYENWTSFTETIDRWNQVMENATRLAAFNELINQGFSDHQAGKVAKELTINFDRRGTNPWLNSLYLFFNAGVQGPVNSMKWLAKDPEKAKKALVGIAAGGFLLAELGRAALGQDDDGVDRWDKVADWVKENSFILPIPGFGADDFLQIPKPYGWGAVSDLGQLPSDLIHGRDPIEATAAFVASVSRNFNPISGGMPMESTQDIGIAAMQTAVPTVFDPIMEAFVWNKDWKGIPVRRDDEASLAQDMITNVFHVAKSWSGGTGKFLDDVTTNAAAVVGGTYGTLEPYEKMTRRYYGAVPSFTAKNAFFAASRDLKDLQKDLHYDKSRLNNTFDPQLRQERAQRIADFKREHRIELTYLHKRLLKVEDQTAKLRGLKEAASSKQQEKRYDDQMVKLMKDYLAEYNRLTSI